MNMKKFANHFFVAIGACASLLTMISFFFSIQWKDYPIWTWIVLAVIILMCVGYACYQVSRKKKITIRIEENFKLTIEQGNLFDQKGIIVIPVNNYFDTHVGDGIIDPKSVHGQFINNLFHDRISELDEKITRSLEQQGLVGIEKEPRKNGKCISYPLGTCAVVADGGNLYVCVVTTEFDEENVARLTRNKLSMVMDGLFDKLVTIAGSEKVSLPIVGAGNARLNRSSERILHYLVDYFDFSLSDKKILGGVHIIIPDLSNINLNRLDDVFGNKGKQK